MAAISTNPLGYFDTLPVELKFHVFGYVSSKQFSTFALEQPTILKRLSILLLYY